MKIAVLGLGRMGMQIAHKLIDGDHQVVAFDLDQNKVDEAHQLGAIKAEDKQQVIEAFGSDPVILWIMLPADIVDQQVDEWLKLLPRNSIIIDGGNSDYRLTQRLNQHVNERGISLVDVGVSGGIWGYQNGFSMMCGVDDINTFESIEPVLKSLAAPEGSYAYFGPSGSGHYVKMVHNAIEYGIMESLAEGYRMLKEGPYKDLDLAKAGDVWQHHSVITSWLNEICRDVLVENPNLSGVDGYVAENGEAKWTLETAKELNIPMPSIQAAFDVRIESQKGNINFATKILSATRNRFGGHALNKDD